MKHVYHNGLKALALVALVALLGGCYAPTGPKEVVEITGDNVTVTGFGPTRTFSGTERFEHTGQASLTAVSPTGFTLRVLVIRHEGPLPFSTRREEIRQTYTAQPGQEVTLTWQ